MASSRDSIDPETRRQEIIEKRLYDETGFGPFTSPDGDSSYRVDLTSLMVLKAIGEAAEKGEYAMGARRAFNVARLELPPKQRKASRVFLTGEHGARFGQRAMSALFKEGQRDFGQQLPAYEWLWMIRRLPLSSLKGHNEALNLRLLMSALAVTDNVVRPGEYPGGIVPVGRHHGRALARLSGYADVLGNLEMSYRWLGKNGDVRMDFDQGRISIEADMQLRDRLQVYDRQVSEEGGWGGLGIPLSELASPMVPPPGDGPLLLLHSRSRVNWIEASTPEGMRLERYAEQFVGYDELFELLGQPDAPPPDEINPDMAALLVLLASYRILAASGHLQTANVRMVGYSVHVGDPPTHQDSVFGEALRQGLQLVAGRFPVTVPGSVSELWRALRTMRPTHSPRRPGPVILPNGETGWIVDWYVASMRFLVGMRFPRVTGRTANLRADAFEEQVRRAISRTSCAPASWIAELVGRHLRRRGEHQAFGEFDAAATLPGGRVHLMIFCKSYAFTDDYERGAHREVRNVASRLAEDIDHALQLAVTLRDHPEGANYRVPVGEHLVPVVVTPRPMYTHVDIAQRRWFNEEWGPRVHMGVGGLLSFLRGYDPDEDEEPNSAEASSADT